MRLNPFSDGLVQLVVHTERKTGIQVRFPPGICEGTRAGKT